MDFSRYHDGYKEVESMLMARMEDLKDFLGGFVGQYHRMEEELRRAFKENETIRSTIKSTLYEA